MDNQTQTKTRINTPQESLDLLSIAGRSSSSIIPPPPPPPPDLPIPVSSISPTSTCTHSPSTIALHGSQFIECLDSNPNSIIIPSRHHPCLVNPNHIAHRLSLPKSLSSTHSSSSSPLAKFLRRLSRNHSPTTTTTTATTTSSSPTCSSPFTPPPNSSATTTKLSFRNIFDLNPSGLNHSQGSSTSLSPSPSSQISAIPFLISRPQTCIPPPIPPPSSPTFSSALQTQTPPSTTLPLNSSSPHKSPQILSAPPTTLTFSISKSQIPIRKRITSLVQKTPYPSLSKRPPSPLQVVAPASLLDLYRPPTPPFKVLNRRAFRRGSIKINKATTPVDHKLKTDPSSQIVEETRSCSSLSHSSVCSSADP